MSAEAHQSVIFHRRLKVSLLWQCLMPRLVHSMPYPLDNDEPFAFLGTQASLLASKKKDRMDCLNWVNWATSSMCQRSGDGRQTIGMDGRDGPVWQCCMLNGIRLPGRQRASHQMDEELIRPEHTQLLGSHADSGGKRLPTSIAD
jgi:hypothetical protein